MEQLQGQIDIFQYLSSIEEKIEKKPVFKVGQKLYKVILGNITEYIIKSFYDIHDGEDFGMTLETENGNKNCGYGYEIDQSLFKSYEKAQIAAAKNLKGMDVVFAEDMNITSQKVFYYIRKCDGRKMYVYYAILDNGFVYTKDHYTYDHLMQRTEKEAFKNLEKQMASVSTEWIEEFALPYPLKNMYRCEEGGKWLYTEAECSYVKGKKTHGVNYHRP